MKLQWILSILLPLFKVEYVTLSDRFCGRNNIEMGGGVKENKDVRDWKILFSKNSVSTLFAQDCRNILEITLAVEEVQLFHCYDQS